MRIPRIRPNWVCGWLFHDQHPLDGITVPGEPLPPLPTLRPRNGASGSLSYWYCRRCQAIAIREAPIDYEVHGAFYWATSRDQIREIIRGLLDHDATDRPNLTAWGAA